MKNLKIGLVEQENDPKMTLLSPLSFKKTGN